MDFSASSLSQLPSSAELKGSKTSEEGDESDSSSEDDHPSMSQVKLAASSQEQNRFRQVVDSLKEQGGYLGGYYIATNGRCIATNVRVCKYVLSTLAEDARV
jgi:hypothetical protein